MPLYEYRCRECRTEFEVLQSLGADSADLTCPSCGAGRPDKQLSTFACGEDRSATASASASPGCSGFT